MIDSSIVLKLLVLPSFQNKFVSVNAGWILVHMSVQSLFESLHLLVVSFLQDLGGRTNKFLYSYVGHLVSLPVSTKSD
jgi:hypothetical protein